MPVNVYLCQGQPVPPLKFYWFNTSSWIDSGTEQNVGQTIETDKTVNMNVRGLYLNDLTSPRS